MSLYRLQPRAFHLPAGGRDAVSSSSSRKGPPRVTTSILLPAILVAALLAWAVMLFNRLVRLRNQVRTAWADIDVQLTRRHDLVPSLVAAVKGYAGHEAALLEAVTALRARATRSEEHTSELQSLMRTSYAAF